LCDGGFRFADSFRVRVDFLFHFFFARTLDAGNRDVILCFFCCFRRACGKRRFILLAKHLLLIVVEAHGLFSVLVFIHYKFSFVGNTFECFCAAILHGLSVQCA